MADLIFIVELFVAIALVCGPIVLIVLLLASDERPVSDLYTLPNGPAGDQLPPEEEMPPRWRVDLAHPPHPAIGSGPRPQSAISRPLASRTTSTTAG